jgi:succinate-semialdehyde dehydrogenase / glutarate-semialdehyde dehydrogenase
MELMFVGSERCASTSGATLEILNPATSEYLDEVPDASLEDAVRALTIAGESKMLWAKTPLHERIAIIDRFLIVIREHQSELARLLSLETGKRIQESEEEVEDTYRIFRGFAERVGPAMYGMATELDLQPGLPGDYLITRREPLGVVVAILPFNFPLEMYAHKVAPALLSGNSVVVKPSEEAPLATLKVTEWLRECGMPGYALQCLTGRGEIVGEALVKDARVQAISMTGSTEVGIHIYERAAKQLSRVFLELGGNDPLVVLPDADLDLAVDMTVQGRTLCAGQCCSASKRMIVHIDVFDEFVDLLMKKLADYKSGDPLSPETMLGTVISIEAAERANLQVQHTQTQGARIEMGGSPSRAFFPPTVLLDVTPEMDVARDMEIFAPVFPIISARSDQEMVQIANGTSFGLSAGVFTKDMEKAFTFAANLECGLVVINGNSLYRPYNHQHGGYKRSGIGREGFDVTIQELTQNKGIAFRKVITDRVKPS